MNVMITRARFWSLSWVLDAITYQLTISGLSKFSNLKFVQNRFQVISLSKLGPRADERRTDISPDNTTPLQPLEKVKVSRAVNYLKRIDENHADKTFLTRPLLVPTNATVWFPVVATATEVTSSSYHETVAGLETGSAPLIGWLMSCSPQ